ncbi:MAG: hypothetical protein AB8G05_23805 [Oligoflexales bacterium]
MKKMLILSSLALFNTNLTAGNASSTGIITSGNPMNVVGNYVSKNEQIQQINVTGNLKAERSKINTATVVGNVLAEEATFDNLSVVGRPKLINSHVAYLTAVTGKAEFSGQSTATRITIDTSGDSNTNGPIIEVNDSSRINSIVFKGKSGVVKISGGGYVDQVTNGSIQ